MIRNIFISIKDRLDTLIFLEIEIKNLIKESLNDK